MPLITLWLRREARARGRGLLACALLVAVTSATVLAAVAGAVRGATAVDRLLAVTRPATAEVVPNKPGFDWARVRSMPQVAALTTFPAYSNLPTDASPGDDSLSPFIPADDAAMRDIEVPVVLAGRLPDAASPAEAVVTPAFAATTGRGVGAMITARLQTPAQVDASFVGGQAGQPAGPAVRLRIVGVVRSLWYSDDVSGRGALIPSPGLLASHQANFLGASGSVPLNAIVRLRGGESGLPAFRAALARATGDDSIDVYDLAALAGHFRAVSGFESDCLLAFALAALLAGLLLAGQAVARLAAASASELRVTAALGLTRRQAAGLAAVGPVLVAAAGSAAGVAGAIAASAWLPFGVAASKEPHPGISADWRVLGAGLVAFPAVAAAIAAVTGWLALAQRRRELRARRSVIVAAMARAGLPAPAVAGARFALEPGTGLDAVPARAALLGSVVGVLGVITAFTFGAGVADAAAHPARFGQDYQLLVVFGAGGHDFTRTGPVLHAMAADPDVTGITNVRIGAASSGTVPVLLHSYQPAGTPVPLVLTAGASPTRPGDLVLAPATASRLGVGIGSVVPMTGDRGTRSLQVTGIGFAMESSTAPYDNGGWVTAAGYDALLSGFKEHGALVALRPDADPSPSGPAGSRLEQLGTAAGGGPLTIITPFQPRQLSEITDVRVLPALLGGFLAVLAVGAVGHALAAAVSRRSRDIAVLRALGMTPAQSRWAALTQATVFTAAGLLAGIPLGVTTGRALWRVAAALIPLRYQPPDANLVLLLIIPAALACGLLLALVPGQRAARLRAGQVLRGE